MAAGQLTSHDQPVFLGWPRSGRAETSQRGKNITVHQSQTSNN